MDEDEAPAETRQAYQQAIAEFDHRLRSEIGQPQYVEVTTDLADVLAAADSTGGKDDMREIGGGG